MADIEKAQGSHSPNNGLTNDHVSHVHTHAAHKPSRIGNPGALGLFSFASTTFILSLYNVGTRGVVVPNVVVGMAIFTGGLAQFLAGMWEFPRGNTFGATAFSSFGAFWMSYATILLPSTGIVAAYGDNLTELNNALGIYLVTWFMFTFLLMLGALRRNITFVLLLGFLSLTFLILAVAQWTAKASIVKAGGALGVVTAFIAYYAALSELLVKDESLFTLPLGDLSKRND